MMHLWSTSVVNLGSVFHDPYLYNEVVCHSIVPLYRCQFRMWLKLCRRARRHAHGGGSYIKRGGNITMLCMFLLLLHDLCQTIIGQFMKHDFWSMMSSLPWALP